MKFNNAALSLRPECECDGAFLSELYRSTREDLLQLALPQAMLDSLIEMQFNAQHATYRSQFPDARHHIVEKAGERIGALLVHRGDKAIRLVYLAFLPQARNQGSGRVLIASLQAEAASAAKPLALSVSTLNAPAQHLYASMGFRPMGSDGINIEMKWENNRLS